MSGMKTSFEVTSIAPSDALDKHGSKNSFRTDIQGLRGIAVSAVVIEHAFPNILPGGYVGVDIFFVISGFLISGIVARDIDLARFSIVDFYRRRVRRIFPALIIVMLTTLLAGALILGPFAFQELANTALYTLIFASNFIFASMGGYFDGDARIKPLLHLWSLAVEEQFYIFFPPFMMICWRKIGPKRTGYLALAAFLLSLLFAEVSRRYYANAVYYMLPPRAFEILLGVIFGLGTVPPLRTAAIRNAASLLGLAMILAACFLFTPATPMPSIAALLPCGGAILIIHAGSGGPQSLARGTLGGRLISYAPLVFIGAISYSLYLWHWPVLAFMRNIEGLQLPVAWAMTAVVLAVLLASVTYYLVEQPFLTPPARDWPVFKLGVSFAAVIGVACVAVLLGRGIPQRFTPETQLLFASSGDYNTRRKACHYDGGKTLIAYEDSCIFGAANVRPDVAVWGDSHGAELVVIMGEHAAHQGRSVRELTSSACAPTIGYAVDWRPLCPVINKRTLAGLVDDPAIKTVILAINAAGHADKARLKTGLHQDRKSVV